MSRKHLMTLALNLFFLTLCSSFSPAFSMELRLGHATPAGVTHDIAAKHFAKLVDEKTGGALQIKVFGNSQLGSLQELWAQVKTGAIDLFVQDPGAAFMVEPPPKNFMITLFPYVFKSQEHFHKFVESEMFSAMMDKVEKAANVEYIGYLGDRAPRGFGTSGKRVSTPEEMENLKLRVPEVPPFVMAYKAWGANPTPIQAKDMYTSVKSGMVAGMDIDMASCYAAKYYEILDYYSAIDYMRSGVGVWMYEGKWKELSGDFQKALREAASETVVHVNKVTADQLAEAEKNLMERGMEIIKPDPTPWMERTRGVVLGAEGKMWKDGLYEKIQGLR